MAECDDRADRTNGRRRSHSQSWEPPSMCRCPIPSAWPASAVGSCAGAGRMRQRVRDFYVGHPELVESVLEKGLFLRTEISFGLIAQHAERVNRLASADQVNLRTAALFHH